MAFWIEGKVKLNYGLHNGQSDRPEWIPVGKKINDPGRVPLFVLFNKDDAVCGPAAYEVLCDPARVRVSRTLLSGLWVKWPTHTQYRLCNNERVISSGCIFLTHAETWAVSLSRETHYRHLLDGNLHIYTINHQSGYVNWLRCFIQTGQNIWLALCSA